MILENQNIIDDIKLEAILDFYSIKNDNRFSDINIESKSNIKDNDIVS